MKKTRAFCRLSLLLVLAGLFSPIPLNAQSTVTLLDGKTEYAYTTNGSVMNVSSGQILAPWDLTTKPIIFSKQNAALIPNLPAASFRGAYFESNKGITPMPSTPLSAVYAEQGHTLIYYLFNPSGNSKIDSGTVSFSVVWGYAISPTALSKISNLSFTTGDADGTYSTIIRDAASKKYYVSNESLKGTGTLLASSSIKWAAISNDLSSVDTTYNTLEDIQIDYIGIYNTSTFDLKGVAAEGTTGYTSLISLSYTLNP